MVSVIVPVYNVEQYFNKCMQSIVSQTYQNLEIILVDDGSTDTSPQMCDAWAEKDSRIRVIHKKNGGLSQTRNCGLGICTGKYIVFIDSDDYIDTDYVAYLYGLLTQYNVDISVCNIRLVNPEGKYLNKVSDSADIKVMDQYAALKELCQNKQVTNSACGKMIRRSIISDISFPEGCLFEDIATVYRWFMNSSRIALGTQSSYYYVQRPGSIISSEFHDRRLDAAAFVEHMCSDIVCRYPDLHDIAQKRLFIEYAYLLRSISLATVQTDVMKHYADTLYQKIKITRKTAWKQGLTLKQKYYAISSVFGCKAMQYALCIEAFIYKQVKLR